MRAEAERGEKALQGGFQSLLGFGEVHQQTDASRFPALHAIPMSEVSFPRYPSCRVSCLVTVLTCQIEDATVLSKLRSACFSVSSLFISIYSCR